MKGRQHRIFRRVLPCVATLALLSVDAGARQAPDASRIEHRAATPRFKAVAFDLLVLFNPDSVQAEAERAFPGKGRELTTVWRNRQFEYCWLRSLTGRYADFSVVTEDSLVYAAGAVKLDLTTDRKRRLLDAYLHLTPWADTGDALRQLRGAGVRVIALTNFSPMMLRANVDSAGAVDLFDDLVSTDANHTYKPDPRAYALGTERLHLSREEILFAGFGAWDVAGAKSFGYPTYWVNRLNQPAEQLGYRPDRTSSSLDGLVDFVLGKSSAR